MPSHKGTGPYIDLTGKTFGRWYVVRYAIEHLSKKAFFLCRCECGTEKTVDGTSLREGRSKSCGCYRVAVNMESEGRNTKPYGYSALTSLYSNYKLRSRKKNQDFTLTKAEFECLTKEPCEYCGMPAVQVFDNGGTTTPYFYNGLDRRDNNKGYTPYNSAPCCKTCNLAKHTLTLEEFIMWIDRLIKFRTNLKVMPSASERN